MFPSIREFLRKHKRKIIVSGAVVLGSFAVGKFIKGKLEEWEEQRIKDYGILAKKQYHFESNQRTCTVTFISFLPDVRNTIAEKMDTQRLLDVLKMKPHNKVEVWEQLKVVSVSQMVSSVVSMVVLLVLLKVHLNIMGGYMIVKYIETGQSIEEASASMNETQLCYMRNIRYFIEDKLPCLLEDCRKVVEDRITGVSLKEKLSHTTFKQILLEIVQALKDISKKKEADEQSTRHGFCDYMIDKRWLDDINKEKNNEVLLKTSETDEIYSKTTRTNSKISESVDEMYSKMTSETIDILEGRDCALVLDQCLHAGLNCVVDTMKDSFCASEDPEAIVSIAECTKPSFYKHIDLPLAKIIPIVCGQFNAVFQAEPNEFIDVLFSQRNLREWTVNLYEAFSKKY